MAKTNPHPRDISVEELVCDESFQHYCMGCEQPGLHRWDQWIADNPERAADFEEARRLISILSAKQGNRLEQLQQLNAGIRQLEFLRKDLLSTTPETAHDKDKRISLSFFRYLAGIAAAVLLAVCLYIVIARQSSGKDDRSAGKTINSGALDRKTSILTDGSVVTLRRNSTLSYKSDFNQSKREVWLSGEAFFDIRHDEKQPFIVHTSRNDIEVLGTSFNVSAYPGARINETSLLRGSVRITSHSDPSRVVVLKPDQKLVTTITPGQTSAPKEETARVVTISQANKDKQEIKWLRKRLNIDNEPLFQIAAKLQNWYGITILFKDEQVKHYRYSGIFENENLIKTLEALQLSYPFKFEIREDQINISSK